MRLMLMVLLCLISSLALADVTIDITNQSTAKVTGKFNKAAKLDDVHIDNDGGNTSVNVTADWYSSKSASLSFTESIMSGIPQTQKPFDLVCECTPKAALVHRLPANISININYLRNYLHDNNWCTMSPWAYFSYTLQCTSEYFDCESKTTAESCWLPPVPADANLHIRLP